MIPCLSSLYSRLSSFFLLGYLPNIYYYIDMHSNFILFLCFLVTSPTFPLQSSVLSLILSLPIPYWQCSGQNHLQIYLYPLINMLFQGKKFHSGFPFLFKMYHIFRCTEGCLLTELIKSCFVTYQPKDTSHFRYFTLELFYPLQLDHLCVLDFP